MRRKKAGRRRRRRHFPGFSRNPFSSGTETGQERGMYVAGRAAFMNTDLWCKVKLLSSPATLRAGAPLLRDANAPTESTRNDYRTSRWWKVLRVFDNPCNEII